MQTLLEFLNTADAVELTELPGLGSALAGRLAAARPFETLEDSLRVSGMNRKLLDRLQSAYEARPGPQPEEELPPPAYMLPAVPAEPAEVQAETAAPVEAAAPAGVDAVPDAVPAAPAGVDAAPVFAPAEPFAAPPVPPQKPSVFWRVVKWLVGLLLVLLILAALAASAYFGLPYLREKYIRPVEENTLRLYLLATQQAADRSHSDATLRVLQADLDVARTRLGMAEKALEAQRLALARVETAQANLQTAQNAQQEKLLADLTYEVQLTRVLDLMGRARLYLAQSNFGTAREDVAAVRALLVKLQPAAPAEQAAAFKVVIGRLDLALENLPAYPVVAANDVEIAWQILIDNLPSDLPPLQLVTPAPVEPPATPTMVAPLPSPTAVEPTPTGVVTETPPGPTPTAVR